MPEPMNGRRALIRIEQLSREQRAAVARRDDALLCRIADLLPTAVAAIDDATVSNVRGAAAILAEAEAARLASIAYLTERATAIRTRLQQTSTARKAAWGYGHRHRRLSQRLDETG